MCWICDERIGDQNTCPFCREVYPACEEECREMILRHANKGWSWAQYEMALDPMEKVKNTDSEHIKRDYEEKALKWLRLAAEQEHPAAERILGEFYRSDTSLVVTQSCSQAFHWFQLAAHHGDAEAQCDLALSYCNGEDIEKDEVEGVYWMTLAASSSPTSGGGQLSLGTYFVTGKGGLGVNLERAKYYLEQAVSDESVAHLVQSKLGVVLAGLGTKRYGSNFIPDHSCIPQCLSLLRKAAAMGASEAVSCIDYFENSTKSFCANCGKAREACVSHKLERCSRCKAAYYCGKKCQKQHWKDGHKKDCCSA